MEEAPELVIRRHSTSLVPNLPPAVARSIASAVLDRVETTNVSLSSDVIYFADGDYNTKTDKFVKNLDPAFNHRRLK